MGERMIATKFLRDEAQIKQDWLCLLMKDENAPLDVTYKANLIKIQREYYPFAIFDVTLEAEWQATSYWEHKEKYQVPREETVYIDYQGKEHKSSGQDTEVRNGNIYHHYRKPMSRTVYDTETRVVIDNVEPTSGYVQPTQFSEKVWTGKGQSLLNWTGHFNNSQMVEVTTEYLKDYVVISEGMTRDAAESQAVSMGRNNIGNVASRDVPGDRYENMSVKSSVLDVKRTSLFLGVYHIFYEYEGKNYECLMCGGDKVDDVVIGDHPVDDTIKTRHEAIQEDIKKNGFFSRRTLFLLGAIILTINSISIIPGMFPANLGSTGSYSGLGIVVKIIISLALIVADAFCIYRYVGMKKAQKVAKAEQANFKESNEYLKKKIYELIQDDTIPEEGKRETIEGWIKAQFGNLESSDQEKSRLQADEKDKWKKIVFLGGITVAVILVFSIMLFVIRPAIRYNGAIKDIEAGRLVEGVGTLKTMPNYKDAASYIEKYGTPMSNISDDVWLRGIELLNYFSSDEFEEEYGDAVKETIEKEFGDDLLDVSIKEYAEALSEIKIFKKYLKEIESLKCSEQFDENYVSDLKGYYFLTCDYIVAKNIENANSTYYYQFELQAHNSKLDTNLKNVLKSFKEEMENPGWGTMLSLKTDHIATEGMYSILGVVYDPEEGIDIDSLKYFGGSSSSSEKDSNDKNSNTETSKENTKESSTTGYSIVTFYGMSFEFPDGIKFNDDGNGQGAFDYLSGSGGMIFMAYDSTEYDINSSNVELYYDQVISANIQDYNPQDMQANGTMLDGCMAKYVQCSLYMENDWRPAVIMAVCNKDYSRMYIISNIIFDRNAYTDEDGAVYEHILDTIGLP